MTEPAPTTPISSEIKATTFTSEQVIQFGKEGATASDALIKKLQEIREKDQSGEGAKKALEKMKIGDKESTRLSKADIEKISQLEGVNETVRKAMQDEIRNVDIFCEIKLRAQRENINEDVALSEIRKSGKWEEVPSSSDINKSVLKALREIGVIRNNISGGTDVVNEAIVTQILSTPDNIEAFREIYAQSKKAAIERINSLKPLKEVEGKKRIEEEIEELEDKTDRHIDALKTITELDDKQLRDLFEQDLEQEAIIESLFQQTLEKKGVQGIDVPEIKKAIQSEITLKSISEEMKGFDDSINAIDERLSQAEATSATTKSAKTERTRNIKAIKAEKERMEAKKAVKQETINRLKTELSGLQKVLKTKILSYKDTYYKIYGKVAGATEEDVVRATAAVPNHVRKLIEQLPQLEQKIKEKTSLEEADKEYQKQLKQRRFEEEDIVRELRAVLNDSMVDFLIKRTDQMSELDIKRQSKEQDEKLNKFDKDLGKRYIEFDGKQEKHYRTKIREDIDVILKYGKEEGELVITARILGGYDADSSKWTEDQRNEIKKVHSQKAENIRTNLFKSYYKSKLSGERSWIKIKKPFSKDILFEGTAGSLALTDKQFENLAEQYSSEMEAGLKSSKQAQEVLKGLKEKGINPNINLKWLLWILIILGIVGGVGFLATKGG